MIHLYSLHVYIPFPSLHTNCIPFTFKVSKIMSYQYSDTGKMYIQEIQKACDTRKEMSVLSDTEVDQTYCISPFLLSL